MRALDPESGPAQCRPSVFSPRCPQPCAIVHRSRDLAQDANGLSSLTRTRERGFSEDRSHKITHGRLSRQIWQNATSRFDRLSHSQHRSTRSTSQQGCPHPRNMKGGRSSWPNWKTPLAFSLVMIMRMIVHADASRFRRSRLRRRAWRSEHIRASGPHGSATVSAPTTALHGGSGPSAGMWSGERATSTGAGGSPDGSSPTTSSLSRRIIFVGAGSSTIGRAEPCRS